MYAGKDFTPGTPGEADVFGFDFTRRLDVGDSIVSATWSAFIITIVDGVEIITPAPQLVPNPVVNTGAITRTKVESLAVGTYRLQASIMSSQGRGPLIYWNKVNSVPVS